ncbi:MAG: polyketide synthase, partial [Myxococcaceae bacterium]
MSLQRFEPLAIVGLACRLPGAPTVEALWAQALSGQSLLTPCPEEWNRLTGIATPLRGGKLEDQPFDWARFRVPPTVLRGMHRIERNLVEGLSLALLDAGAAPRSAGAARTAIYLAASGVGVDERIDHRARLTVPSLKPHLTAELAQSHLAPELADAAVKRALDGVPVLVADTLSTMASVAAGRVAQLFELEGGQFAADCGYASSLSAVKLASQSLALGHCDTALVGALSPLLSPSTYAVLQARGWLSTHGGLHPLDENATGTVPGEGIVALVLKRLDDALADRQRIYAVLRGVAEAGELAGGSARLHRAVDRAARTAVARAEAEGDHVAHVEVAASGIVSLEEDELLGLRGTYGLRTGTPLSISTGAGQAGFQQAASGMLSMVRAALALHHREAAPTAGLSSPRTRV